MFSCSVEMFQAVPIGGKMKHRGVRIISNGHVFHVFGNEIVSLGDLEELSIKNRILSAASKQHSHRRARAMLNINRKPVFVS